MQLLGRNLITLCGERLSEVRLLLQAPFYIMLLIERILKMERITIFKGFTIPVIIKVDEKQQVITAYNTNCEYLAENAFYKLMQGKSQIVYFDFKPKFFDNLRLKSTYKAKARCHDGDVFDVNVGKEIAKEKLANKLRNSIKKRIDAILLQQAMLQNGVVSSNGYKELQ